MHDLAIFIKIGTNSVWKKKSNFELIGIARVVIVNE